MPESADHDRRTDPPPDRGKGAVPAAPAAGVRKREIRQNPLDIRPDAWLHVSDEKRASHTVAIERVEVTRAEGPADPAAREALERLLSRWLVRAYLRRYAGGRDDDVEEAVA